MGVFRLIKLMVAVIIITGILLFLIIYHSPKYSDNYNYLKLTLFKFGKPLKLPAQNLWRPNAEDLAPDDRIVAQLKWIREFASSESVTSKSQQKQILVHDSEDSYYGTNQKIQCPGFEFDRCNITLSKDVKKVGERNSHLKYDAMIFTQNWLHQTEVLVPAHSKQIIYILESPNLARANLSMNNGLLASYSRRSDITIPYSKWIPFDEAGISRSQPHSSILKNYAEGKTEFAAIFVSNCNDTNGRLKYVKELQKYVSVNVYGNCGKKNNKSDMDNILQQHKFYLAFENANCRDYITEKLYRNALKHNIVPVVMGAHPDDYKAVAPLNSFIHIEDFESPRALANYLHILNENSTLYNEYFRWRATGFFYDALGDFFCRACGMLFYADFVAPPTWPRGTEWKSVSDCLPNQQWYWEESKNIFGNGI